MWRRMMLLSFVQIGVKCILLILNKDQNAVLISENLGRFQKQCYVK